MALKIYVVFDLVGKRSLVRANTAAGALAFKRAQVHMKAEVASQDTLLDLAGKVPVEDATSKDAE